MRDNKPFTLLGHTIKPGTKEVILLPAPNINTQARIDIPIHVFHGKKRGPKLFIVGGIHGDEFDSIEIIRRVQEHIKIKRLSGTIITVPVVNIHGLIMQSRYFSDRRDLNRSFPGSRKGTLASRFAHTIIKQVVSHCDYGIDLHTGASGRTNMPQLRIDFTTRGAKELALSFNTPVILSSKQRDGSLRQAASKLKIPVIVYEGGEALRFNELSIRAGFKGIFNVLQHLNMYQSNFPKKSKGVISKTSRWVRAPASGLVEPLPKLLSKAVKKGQILARIHDPFLINPSTHVIAPFEGIIIGQALKPMATEGDALFHIASFKKIAGVRATIDIFHEEIINL